MKPSEFKARVAVICMKYPAGMAGVVHMIGPVPIPPEDMPREEVNSLLIDLEDVASKFERLMS